MKILVCGSRDWGECPGQFAKLFRRLDELDRDGLVIIEGEARGADRAARRWAESNGVAFEPYFAQWEQFGKRAGHLRNQRMLDEGKPDLVIAFHPNVGESKGTRDMVRIARKAGIPVEVNT